MPCMTRLECESTKRRSRPTRCCALWKRDHRATDRRVCQSMRSRVSRAFRRRGLKLNSMLRLPEFRYLAPSSLDEAARWLAEHGSRAMVVAGGTDLYPNMKRRQQ